MMSSPTSSEAPAPGELTVRGLFRKLGPLGPLTIASMTLPALGGFLILYKMNVFAPWLRERGPTGAILYAVGFAIASGLALLPTYAQSLLGGWAFGVSRGSLAALCGVLGGSLIGYAVAYRNAGTRVIELIEAHPKWRAVYDSLVCSGRWRRLWIVTLLRLPPSSPFAFTNLVLAATRVPMTDYAIATVVGLAPRTIAVIYVGSTLQDLSALPADRSWVTLIWAAVTLLVVCIIGKMAQNAISRISTSNH